MEENNENKFNFNDLDMLFFRNISINPKSLHWIVDTTISIMMKKYNLNNGDDEKCIEY